MTVAIKVGAALVLADDDCVEAALREAASVNATARRAGPADVPVRDDLPVGHPLRGKRVLRVVPCGMGDCTLDDEGRLVAVDPKTGEPPKPTTLEVGRDR